MADGFNTSGLLPVCRYWKTQEMKVVGMAQFASRKDMALESKLRVNCEKLIFSSADQRIQTENFWRNFDDNLKKKPNTVYIDGSLGFIKKVCDTVGTRKVRVIVNLMSAWREFVEPFDHARVALEGREFYPVVDGLLVDGQSVDWTAYIKRFQELGEQQQWLNSRSLSSRPKKESGIFPKLLSGLTSGRP